MLWENKFDVHLDTPRDGPVLARNGYFWDIDAGTLIQQVTWHMGVGAFRSAPMTFMTPRVHIHLQYLLINSHLPLSRLSLSLPLTSPIISIGCFPLAANSA